MTDTERAARCAWLRVEIAKGQELVRRTEPLLGRVALLQQELDELDPKERRASESCARCGAAPDEACRWDDPASCSRRPSGAWRAPHVTASCPAVALGGRCARRTA